MEKGIAKHCALGILLTLIHVVWSEVAVASVMDEIVDCERRLSSMMTNGSSTSGDKSEG